MKQAPKAGGCAIWANAADRLLMSADDWCWLDYGPLYFVLGVFALIAHRTSKLFRWGKKRHRANRRRDSRRRTRDACRCRNTCQAGQIDIVEPQASQDRPQTESLLHLHLLLGFSSVCFRIWSEVLLGRSPIFFPPLGTGHRAGPSRSSKHWSTFDKHLCPQPAIHTSSS